MSETPEPRAVGRPSEYRPEHCDRVIELGKAGKSRAQIASALDCSRTTLAAWERLHPEFMNALTRAHDEALAWWEGAGQGGLEKGSAFNASLWAKSMSGRFPNEPYRERLQLTGKDDGPIEYTRLSPDERRQRIAELQAKLNADDAPGD